MQEELADLIEVHAGRLGRSWLSDRLMSARGTRTRISVPVGRGNLIVNTAGEGRVFVVEIWQEGHSWISGKTADIDDVVLFAAAWESGVALADAKRRWPFLEYDRLAVAFEQGNAVKAKWEILRSASDFEPLRGLIELAYSRPKLRMLFPWVGRLSTRLGFSRCTGYPYTRDIPVVDLGIDTFRIVDLSQRALVGEFSARLEAIDAIELAVPASAGPAVSGTADDLGLGDREL